MRALITGGAGFIGGRLAQRLVGTGWSVMVLDDLSSGSIDNIPTDAHLIVADISLPSASDMIADAKADVVIHAAAQVSVAQSMLDPDADFKTNVLGTKHVIDGSRAAGSKRIVFLSSGGAVYGETAGANEDTLPTPKSYYAVHKYVAERYLELSGLGYSVARLANVYGPGQRIGLEGGVVAIFADALRSGRDVTIHGSGRQSRDFVHVDDVVEALVAMIDRDRDGLWNIGTGTTVSILDLLEVMQTLFGTSVNVRYAAPRSGDVFASRLIIDRARDDLDWTPTVSLEQGIAGLAR